MPESCPTPTELRSLVDGLLSDVDAQPLELHIDRCEQCQQALLQLAADETFWETATARLADDKIGGPELDRAVESLKQHSHPEAEEIGEAIELKLSFIEPPVEPGTIGRLQHYDILRVAGRGGMGIVLKAFDRSLRRIVAVKLLAPHLAGNGQARQRFIREGRAAAGICHEHVVTIYAVEESPPLLVMQYVHGETLKISSHMKDRLLICLSSGKALRPWQFKADAARQTELFTLTRSTNTESLRKSVAMTSLDVTSPADWIRESVETWSEELGIPIDRQNSIGIDLTLVPPAHFDVSKENPPPTPASLTRSLLTTYGIIDRPRQGEGEGEGEVRYPFVISSHVISTTQFRQFVEATDYVTDAERRRAAVTTKSKIDDEGPPVEALFAAQGGWTMADTADAELVWKPGLSWATNKSAAPATVVSVRDATAFCEWLSAKENRQYRLPTIPEWTVAAELSKFSTPDGIAEVTGDDSSSPHRIKTPELRQGEWTADWQPISDQKYHIVVQRLVSDDHSVLHEALAPDMFRSSEIGFRVVTELRSGSAPSTMK